MSAKTKTTYVGTSPDGRKTVTIDSTRELVFFTWARGTGKRALKTGGRPTTPEETAAEAWTWLGNSSAADELKAKAAGRGTNPYFAEYAATPATVQA